MSAAEIIREIARLSDAERRKVQAYQVHKGHSENPARAEELARRIDEPLGPRPDIS